MKFPFIYISFLLITAGTPPTSTSTNTNTNTNAAPQIGFIALEINDATLPPDVVQYMDNRDICDHLRGEIPDTTDKRHETETIKNINKYCLNADSKLAALKKKYAGKKAVQEALSGYEERIESTLIYDK